MLQRFSVKTSQTFAMLQRFSNIFLHLIKVHVEFVYATQLPNDFLYAPSRHKNVMCVKTSYMLYAIRLHADFFYCQSSQRFLVLLTGYMKMPLHTAIQ
jgi:hypothetical protein